MLCSAQHSVQKCALYIECGSGSGGQSCPHLDYLVCICVICVWIFVCDWLYSVWFCTLYCALHCIYWACQWLWWAILTPFGSIFLSGSFSTASQLNKSCFFHIQIAPIFSWTMPEWNISDRNWQIQRLRVERNAEERLWGNAVIQFVLARVRVCRELLRVQK